MRDRAITNAQHETTLLRELRLVDATAIVIGTIIGSGIFLVPGSIARQLATFSAVLAAWLLGGALTLFGALSIAELGAAFPRAGGLYVYLERAFGKPIGFLYGWGLLSAIHSGSIATLAAAFSLYISQFVPLGVGGQKAISIACILLLTLVNCLGIKAGKTVQNIFTALKLGGLAVMIALLFARGDAATLGRNFWPGELSSSGLFAFGLSLVAVLWAYEGWHAVSFTAGEIREPARTLPRSLIYGTLIIAVIYVLANIGYYSVLTRAEVQKGNAVAATAIGATFGPAATAFVSLLILLSIFGSMNGMVLTGPRVYYAMARDGLFFRPFGHLHYRYHTPTAAILIQGLWASGLTLLGTFQELFTYVIFTAWIFYGLTVAGVIVLRRTNPELERPFRVPAFPWIPLGFSAAALAITINTIVGDPVHSLVGIAVILAGIPLYWWFRRTQSGLGG